MGPKEIDGLFVSLGKAYTLLAGHLITGKLLWFEPAQEKWFKSNHPYIYKPFWPIWLVTSIFYALVGCFDILFLGKSPIK